MPAVRTFPGIAWRVEAPTTVTLPRMDIAAFVGFAQRGPLQLPVVVESYPDFVNLFGGLYRLAWDGEQGLWQTACLAPAVKAFFAQGGRRCWVVRVASPAAATTHFPLGGLLQPLPNGGYTGVNAQARCPGSWTDNLQTRVEALVTPLAFVPGAVQPGLPWSLNLQTLGNVPLQAGDVLQVDLSDRRHRAYAVVPVLERGSRQGTVTIAPEEVHWFHRLLPAQLPLTGTVQTLDGTVPGTFSATLELPDSSGDGDDEAAIAPILQATLAPDIPLSVLAGEWLSLTAGELTLWLVVEDTTPTMKLRVQVWVEGIATPTEPLALSRVQQIQLALHVRPAEAAPDDPALTLTDLAGAAPHPRFIGYLPADEDLFAPTWGAPPSPPRSPATALWAEAIAPRFPLSFEREAIAIALPLGLEAPLPWRAGQVPSGDTLERDGLVPVGKDGVALTGQDWANFLPTLFLDPVLRYTAQRSLLEEASDRLYLQNQPLTGIHALLPLEEVSLIALPDATLPGWYLTTPVRIAPASTSQPPQPLDPCPKASPFLPCFPVTAKPDPSQNNPPPIQTPVPQWQLLPSRAYDAAGLLEIQLATARLAAARSDWIAVLGFPKHYRLPEVQSHQQQMLGAVRREADTTDSYLALYHPWLIHREETGELVHSHPAGIMAGVMAARALRRGAWIAPANEVLLGVLATLPTFAPADEQALYATGVNPIRQLPQGFVAWGSFTQSMEPDWEDLNVRRLLILLRRLALREGQNLVFAAHDAALRRRVQQQFEQILARLLDLGAFAGRVPAEAFQVVVDNTLNTQARVERGQLIVELRVAPAQPMTFITVRLVQLDTEPLTVQEVRTNGG